MARMKDALVVALEVVAEELLRADHREDVADILDAMLTIARARGVDLRELEPFAAIPYEERSADPLGRSGDRN